MNARVYRFPIVGADRPMISDVIASGRREDAANLRRRCRVQADVARSCAEQAVSLSEDALQDGHDAAVKRLRLAALRFKQAQRELRQAEKEINA